MKEAVPRERLTPRERQAAITELRRVRDYVRDEGGRIDIYDVATFALQRANELEGWTS